MSEERQVKEYMQFIIQDICDRIGPRPPCSPEEVQCAHYFESELKKNTDLTTIEKFNCHPGSYRAQFRISMIIIISTTIFYWFHFLIPNLAFLIIPLCLNIFAIIVIQTNVMRNIEFIDPLFKEEESTNVLGRFLPKEKSTNRLVIGGHHDSNWEFSLLRKNWILFGIVIVFINTLPYILLGIFVTKFVLHFLSSPYIFIPQIDLAVLIFLNVLLPFFIYAIPTLISHRPVMGADDNLSALAVILAVARFLNENKLKNTEVWLVSHGCEEIGDRGSKRFSEKHHSELKNALVINLDMVGGKGAVLRFVTSEVMFIVKLSKKIANELVKIAVELDIPYQLGQIEAFTDSMAYAKNKIRACSIIGIPKKGLPRHYHTRHDTIDKIDFHNLWNCYNILLKFLEKVDNNEILI